uniref:Uncharacterized protein n=1 Tax=viral metagenome TaxID=1070528 RepID=A0A6C0J8C9_9ZZZZ
MSSDENSYMSTANSFTNDLAIDSSFHGVYDAISDYNMVRLWVNTPAEAQLRITYADNSNGDNDSSEVFGLYAGNHSSIHNLKKNDFAKVSLINTSGVLQEQVLLTTKFASRIPHPFLNYTNDNVTAHTTIALDEFRLTTTINNEDSSLLIYGLTDTCVNTPMRVTASGEVVTSLTVSGEAVSDTVRLPVTFDNSMIEVTQDTAGDLHTSSHLVVNGSDVTNANTVPVTFDNSMIEVTQDVSGNLHTSSHLVLNNFPVGLGNPIPVINQSNSPFKFTITEFPKTTANAVFIYGSTVTITGTYTGNMTIDSRIVIEASIYYENEVMWVEIDTKTLSRSNSYFHATYITAFTFWRCTVASGAGDALTVTIFMAAR